MDDLTCKEYEQAFIQTKPTEDIEILQGEKRKIIQPASLKDPGLQTLKEVLVDWINSTLKREHIVVQTLEEDLFDGLVLHHLLARLGDVQLDVDEIALTSSAQTQKLSVIMQALDQRLGVQNKVSSKWNVKLIHSRDLLATLHLLVAMVKHFQPELDLPSNVALEVVTVEVNKNGIKTEKQMEQITEAQGSSDNAGSVPKQEDPIDELLRMEPEKVETVKKAILHFVNKTMTPLGVQVTDMDRQFADGVILLLLIGQVEGYFVPLCNFNLTPTTTSEMLQNITLAMDLLNDQEIQVPNVDPKDILSQDAAATMKVLYAIFKKHKNKGGW